MKTIIITIVFAFGGEERILSYPVKDMAYCYKHSEQLLQTRNVQQAICSELRKMK